MLQTMPRVKRATGARVMRRLWSDRYVYLMILPVVAYFAVMKYWPLTWLRITLYDYKLLKGFDGSAFVGLKHFIDFFTGSDFIKLLGNTVMINVYALLIVFPAPILFAVLLNELRHKFYKRTVQTVSYLPHFISMVVLTSMIAGFLSPTFGAVNLLLKRLGMETVYFLGDPRYFRSIMIASGIWQGTGWSAIIYLAAITGIDQELYQAAMIDGANRWQRITRITLPSISNTIVILFILQIGNMMNVNFEKVFLLQNNLNLSTSEVLQTYIYKIGVAKTNYSFGSAVGLFNSVVSLGLVLIANALSRRFSDSRIF